METNLDLSVENIYPDGDNKGHVPDENCTCRPKVSDFGDYREILHYDLTHKNEEALELVVRWSRDAFHTIAIESTDAYIIRLAKEGIKQCDRDGEIQVL